MLEHLRTIVVNRKCGAAKAAETRRRNKQEKQSTENWEEIVLRKRMNWLSS